MQRTMGLIHGGWLVAKILKREGVEVVFTLSGGHVAAIYGGCLRHEPPAKARGLAAGLISAASRT